MSEFTYVLASNNTHKLAEIDAVVGTSFTLVPQSDFNVPEAVEDGLSFVENAIIKARHACLHTGMPALADDSGLAVDCLDGAPGIFSARYAGGGATAADNNQKLIAAIADVPERERTARFHCVIVVMQHARDPTPIIAAGVLEGQVITSPRGANGFGYDPLFLLPDRGQTLAELSTRDKNLISHRARALASLAARLTSAK